MLAVIGVLVEPLTQFVNELQAEGHSVYISNYNCAGQYSLAGTREAIETTKSRITKLDPKIVVEIPVEYAWHCPLVEAAEQPIAAFLKGCDWRLPEIPLVNCESGLLFPHDVNLIKEQFLKQLANPVRWDKSIKTLLSEGCSRLVEVGYGNMLTKFGFFIDRSVQHESYFGEKVAICAE
jgi:(acyl-carrier-protein) S-malonyltransferase